jgi:hypothetical protein
MDRILDQTSLYEFLNLGEQLADSEPRLHPGSRFFGP